MQTAVEYFDEQIQERVIAQDVVARKMIIEISMEDYMDIKRQAKEMEKRMFIDIVEKSRATGLTAEYLLLTYGSKGSDEHFKQFSLYEHKETIATADTPTSSQTEISDEEIEKAWSIVETTHVDKWVSFKSIFIEGAKWYREQLKKKQ